MVLVEKYALPAFNWCRSAFYLLVVFNILGPVSICFAERVVVGPMSQSNEIRSNCIIDTAKQKCDLNS